MTGKRCGRTSRVRRARMRSIQGQQRPIVTDCFQIAHLEKWIKSYRAQQYTFRLRPTNFPGTGRGMMALKSVGVGDVIASIPCELLINCRVALSDKEFCEVLTSTGLKYEALQVLSLYLLYQTILKDESSWKLYLTTLPSTYTVPAYCTQEEIQALPQFLQQIALEQKMIVSTFHTKTQGVLDKLCERHSCTKLIVKDDFQWAWFSVNTRVVYLKESFPTPDILVDKDVCCLAPYLDLLNHSAKAEVKVGVNSSNNCYEITTQMPYRKYEQVFINYGPHDNINLYKEYGFILDHNPHNSVPVTVADILAVFNESISSIHQIEYDSKIEVIEENMLHKNICITEGGPSWSLEFIITLLLMRKEELSRWQNLYTEGIDNVDYRHLVIIVLQKLIETKLKELQQSLSLMENISFCSETFKIAKQLIRECCSIIESCIVNFHVGCQDQVIA